jgi:predicted permease
MGVLGQILYGIAGLGSLVCFILVLVQMFQRGQSTLGIVCIVLIFCFGIGGLIAFVYGWMKHREWGITNIMYAWTGCWILGIIGAALYFPTIQFVPQPVLPR